MKTYTITATRWNGSVVTLAADEFSSAYHKATKLNQTGEYLSVKVSR